MTFSEHTALLNTGTSRKVSFWSFLRAFWPLPFVSFGGPQAHVALLHDKFVAVPPGYTGPQVSEPVFLEMWALAQSLPGPDSTQLITTLGATFGAFRGAALTFFIWQIPGFICMTAAGLWFNHNMNATGSKAIITAMTDRSVGLIASAFAFVVLAAFKIVSKSVGEHPMKMMIALVSMSVAVMIPASDSSWVFVMLLLGGGIAFLMYTMVFGQEGDVGEINTEWDLKISSMTGSLLILFVLVMTIVIALLPSTSLDNRVMKIFWQIGLLVFGGGIVAVPMLINEFVESGLLPASVFLAGFGLFGCIPGPMFNLAPFLGAAVLGLRGALYGSFGMFGPGVLLQLGVLPLWHRIRRIRTVQTILQGTKCAAAGLIVAGVWMLLGKALVGPAAFALMCSAGAGSLVFKISPVKIIVSHGLAGILFVTMGIGGPYHLASSMSA